MADVIARLRVDSKDFDSKIDRARSGLLRLEESLKGAGKSFADADKDQVAFVAELGKMQTVAQTMRGKLSELTKAYTDLSVQYKRMTDEEKSSPFGKAMSESMDQLKSRISETKIQLDEVNKELGETSRESGDASGALDMLASKFGISTKSLIGWGAAIGAGKVALDVAKDAFNQSESNIDEWGRTVESAKGAYNVFLDTINGGNWSNFFENLGRAIQGGRDLYDAFDRLSSIKANNQLAITMVQAQIQQLRVLKQQGQNVDGQIKAASERLRALQMASVVAGKQAGSRQLATTLTNRVSSISGSGIVSSAEIGRAAANYAVGGQAYIDQQKAIYERLSAKGAYQYQAAVGGSVTGSTATVTQTGMDMSKLTEEEQKQYIIAKAITEGETELQQGLATLAQAVQEEASSWQQQFRNNRYEFQQPRGSGGGGKSGGTQEIEGGIKGIKEFDGIVAQTTESLADLRKQLAEYQAARDTATNTADYAAAQQGIADTQRRIGAQEAAIRLGVDTDSILEIEDKMKEELENMKNNLPKLEIKAEVNADGVRGLSKEGTNAAQTWAAAAKALSSAGAALQQIEDPGVKIAGIVGQAVANIALGFAQAAASPATGALGVFGWIAAATAGVATMISTIASIKSATAGSYEEGGIVPGTSFHGDHLTAAVNSGELILTRSQQDNIAAQLQSVGNVQSMSGQPYTTGENIVLGINNHFKRSGQGEIVTTSMLRKYGIG